jgi:hypothetical protein
MARPRKPKPPLTRLVREGDTGAKCPFCGSSLKRSLFRRIQGCIQPECTYYYDKKVKIEK